MQRHIFTDNGNFNRALKLLNPAQHALPLTHIRRRRSQLQVVDYNFVQAFVTQIERNFI
ncbi:hypothetical protein D3C80_2242370 [compost metagenome]